MTIFHCCCEHTSSHIIFSIICYLSLGEGFHPNCQPFWSNKMFIKRKEITVISSLFCDDQQEDEQKNIQ